MRARVRPDRLHAYPTFRRAGHTFGPEWKDVVDGALSPEALNFMVNESGHVLEFDGPPSKPAAPAGTPSEAVVAAAKAGASLPGHPSIAEAERVTEHEAESEDDADTTPDRRKPPHGRGRAR